MVLVAKVVIASLIIIQTMMRINQGPDTLFKKLPDPKMDTNPDIEEEVDEFLRNLRSRRKSLRLESLHLSTSKTSDLFVILPAPKNVPMTNRTFVLNVLTNKKPTATITRPKQETKPKISEKRKLPQESDDEDYDETKIIPDAEEEATPDTTVDSAPDAQEPYAGLDNEAFNQLVGSGKLHKLNSKLVNEAEVLPEKDAWVTKAHNDPEANPKGTAVNDPVNNTCKKKHHITYLAQQWSASQFSRKQTQAKYGF
ncbi:PREDICTED: uncharacterized protein LOC108569061 [Nicrophorus vespilloides]|uniref:Uncharacterized protein LOC108569061 n=1 Tax=Nicrophorus vespilloides TaxID=110193 RepID=A0ABM1NGJ1_NICVS|nr:PREDICTED: uncharacterized protein LOC108569061 [Nicrophorus vespilloides]